jgi:magnesium chelatase family protein
VLLETCCAGRDALRLLERAAARFGLSARACHRVLRVARTIADMAGCAAVEQAHIAEALSLRQLDRSQA